MTPTPSHTPAGIWRAVPWALLIAAGVFFLLALPSEVLWTNDANLYLGGAASLARGAGYRLEPYLGSPPIGVYPPLQSALLALAWSTAGPFPGNAHALILIQGLVAVAGVMLLYLAMKAGGVGDGWALGVALLLGTSNVWLLLTAHVFSDVPFATLACAFVCLSMRAARGGPSPASAHWLPLGLCAGLLWLTRSSAAPIVAGLCLTALVLRSPQRPARLGAVVVPILLCELARRAIADHGGGYGSYFEHRWFALGGITGYLRFVAGQVWDYAAGRYWLELLFTVPFAAAQSPRLAALPLQPVITLLGLTLNVLVLRGLWMHRREPFWQAAAFLAGLYLLQLILWPFHLGARCMVPLLPLGAILGIDAVRCVPRTGATRSRLAAVLGAVLVANVLGNAAFTWRYGRSIEAETAESLGRLRQLADAIRREVPESAALHAGRDVPVNHLQALLGRRFLPNPAPWPLQPHAYHDVPPASQGQAVAAYSVRADPPRDGEGPPGEPVPIGVRGWTLLRLDLRAPP